MNMKILPKLAVGTMCLAATTFASSSCSSKDNSCSEDTCFAENLEIEEGDEILEPIYIECNSKLLKRINGDRKAMTDHAFQYGTNASSIYYQFGHDMEKMPSASNVIKEIAEEISLNSEYSEEEMVSKLEALDELAFVAEEAESNYKEQYQEDMEELLLDEGGSTLGRCESFLANKFKALHSDLPKEKYDKKLREYNRDVNYFKSKQGKMNEPKQAELFAYQQYKIDSIANGRILENVLGQLMNANVLNLYKNDHSRYSGKPKP